MSNLNLSFDPQAVKLMLEDLIDRNGLANVLEFIAEVCGEKADHVRVNW